MDALTDPHRFDVPLPAGARVLDEIHSFGPLFERWLERWRSRIVAGELVTILVAVDYSHAVAVARPGPTRPLGARQLELFDSHTGPMRDPASAEADIGSA